MNLQQIDHTATRSCNRAEGDRTKKAVTRKEVAHIGRPLRETFIDERYYGDGPPFWTIGPKNLPPPTQHDADKQRRKIIKRVRRWAASDPTMLAVADRLEACTSGQRC